MIRARFHLDGSRLTITTNSNERADRMLERLHNALPVTVVSDTRREQLERLVASFDAIDATPGAITMRTDHLREMLGL